MTTPPPRNAAPSPRLAWASLVAAVAAAALWYHWPQVGAWPLLLGLAPWPVARRLPPRSPAHIPLFAFTLTAAVSLGAAYDPATAWAKFWLIIGGWLLFTALVALHQAGLVRQAAWLLAALGAVVSLYFLCTNDWDSYPTKIAMLVDVGRVLRRWMPAFPGHPLHPNVVGGLLGMSLPFAATTVWSNQGWRRAGGAGLLFFSLVGLLFTASRGAWAALAGAALLIGGWQLAGWVSRRRSLPRRWLMLGGLCLSASLALAFLLFGAPAWGRLLAALPGPNSTLSRLDLYRGSLSLAADYPLLGAGLGSFPLLYASYSLLVHVGHSIHAHNLWLDVAIEQGGLGVLALGWLVVLAGISLWRATADGRAAAPLAAGALSLTTILAHGMVDDAFYGSRALLLLFAPLAFVLADPRPRQRRQSRRRLAAALLLALLALLPWQRQPRALAWRNFAAARQSRIELTVYQWPDWPLQDAVRRAVDLSQPIAAYERALALDPANASANRRLGQIELSLGDYDRALAHLQAAYAAAPSNNATRQLLGEAIIVTGGVDAGTTLWAGINQAQGQLALRAFWYEHLGDEQRLAWVHEAMR